MITNNTELYTVLDELVAELAQLGASKLVFALETALGVSSLPGEVLGEVRIQLLRVRESRFFENAAVSSKVDASLRYIEEVL